MGGGTRTTQPILHKPYLLRDLKATGGVTSFPLTFSDGEGALSQHPRVERRPRAGAGVLHGVHPPAELGGQRDVQQPAEEDHQRGARPHGPRLARIQG